jgi:hypothetical protein
MYKFASAIFENRIVYMKIQRISQDIYLSNQSPHIKTGSVRNLSNQC